MSHVAGERLPAPRDPWEIRAVSPKKQRNPNGFRIRSCSTKRILVGIQFHRFCRARLTTVAFDAFFHKGVTPPGGPVRDSLMSLPSSLPTGRLLHARSKPIRSIFRILSDLRLHRLHRARRAQGIATSPRCRTGPPGPWSMGRWLTPLNGGGIIGHPDFGAEGSEFP